MVDPEGYVVAQLSGEGHAHGSRVLLDELVAEHEAKGTLHRGNGPYVAPEPRADHVALPCQGRTAAERHVPRRRRGRITSSSSWLADLETVVRRIGSGTRGCSTGRPVRRRSTSPTDCACCRPRWRGAAATTSWSLTPSTTPCAGCSSRDGNVLTVAGTGRQWMHGDPVPMSSDPAVPLSSPWDVVWWPGWDEVAVAMAGIHQLWSFDPVTPSLTVRAGTANEGLRDGPPEEAWLAQSSGLATAEDEGGDRLWFVDSETSSLRALANGAVTTLVGSGLFEFGLVDGAAEDALLQHPLGVTALPDGSVAVSDTYNGAIRRYDPATHAVTTLVDGSARALGLGGRR